jgi:replicative DNA helicase
MENKIEEEMIIACWLRGDHLDTIPLFEVEDFVIYRDVVKAISKRHKEGEPISLVEVASESGAKTATLATMLTTREIDFYGCGVMLKRKRIAKIASMNLMFTKESDRAIELFEQFKNTVEGVSLVKVDQCAEFLEEMDRRALTDPVLTGLTRLDNLLGGLRQGELTTIAARPGVGKSAFCLQVANHAAEQGKKVLFFALEMSRYEVFSRNVSKWSSIPSHKFRKGSKYFTDKESSEMVMLLDTKLREFSEKVWVETTIANIDAFKGIIEREKPDLVIIDQLSCLRTSQGHKTIRERFCYCTTLLKRMSVELNIPILLAAQLSRSAENKKPTLADLKESGSIEEDSDNCILLWNRQDENEGDIREVVLELAKHRQGETGMNILNYIGSKTKFYEVM